MRNIDTSTGVFGRMKIAMLTIGAVICAPSSAAGLIDPTRPSSFHVNADPVYTGPILQSTMISSGIKRAVISGKTYTVGEQLGAAVITNISSYEVTLNKDGRETRLRIVPSLAKEIRPMDGKGKGVNP